MSAAIGIYEYTLMTTDQRAACLWEHGTFLDNRVEKGFKYILYSLNNFYVEVTYDSEENGILEYTPFKTTKKLEPYLDEINLPEI
jgi:hypothetical protein